MADPCGSMAPSEDQARGSNIRRQEIFRPSCSISDLSGAGLLRRPLCLACRISRLHSRYPFLNRNQVWQIHVDRWRLAKIKREDLTRSDHPCPHFIRGRLNIRRQEIFRPSCSISDLSGAGLLRRPLCLGGDGPNECMEPIHLKNAAENQYYRQ
jgi:hypothetical protein